MPQTGTPAMQEKVAGTGSMFKEVSINDARGRKEMKGKVCVKKARRIGNFWQCPTCGYKEFA